MLPEGGIFRCVVWVQPMESLWRRHRQLLVGSSLLPVASTDERTATLSGPTASCCPGCIAGILPIRVLPLRRCFPSAWTASIHSTRRFS